MSNIDYKQAISGETAVIAYLDLANMLHWQQKLGWRFRVEDVIREIAAIPSVKEVKVYYGLNNRDLRNSQAFHARIRKAGATLRMKPMKWIKKVIGDGLFMKQTTLALFDEGTTVKIAALAEEMRQKGVTIEEPKCNFDVEMTMDLLDDASKVSAVVLYSGDSDLRPVLERLKLDGKKIYVVGVRGMVATELHEIKDTYIDFGKFYTGKRSYL